MPYAPWLAAAVLTLVAVATRAAPGDLYFAGACDGSAAAVLDDGRLAVADDEHSLLHVYLADGGVPVNRDVRAFLGFSADSKDEADIEAAARVGDRIYWIGSHSHNKNGKLRPERQVLFATTADATLVPIGMPARTLLDALLAQAGERDADDQPTALAQAIGQLGLAALAVAPIAPEAGGINIEALAAGPGGSLLIGFRSPRAGPARSAAGAPALVIPLLNPKEVVDSKAAPRFGMPLALDLAGLGLRDLLRRADGSYVIIAGPTKDGPGFALYTWLGPGRGAPLPLSAALAGLRPEAVVERGGKLLLLSDDGDDQCKAAAPTARGFAGRLLP